MRGRSRQTPTSYQLSLLCVREQPILFMPSVERENSLQMLGIGKMTTLNGHECGYDGGEDERVWDIEQGDLGAGVASGLSLILFFATSQ